MCSRVGGDRGGDQSGDQSELPLTLRKVNPDFPTHFFQTHRRRRTTPTSPPTTPGLTIPDSDDLHHHHTSPRRTHRPCPAGPKPRPVTAPAAPAAPAAPPAGPVSTHRSSASPSAPTKPGYYRPSSYILRECSCNVSCEEIVSGLAPPTWKL